MPMFGNLFGSQRKRAPGDLVQDDPSGALPGIEGAPSPLLGAPQAGGFFNKLGMVGDILTGNPVTATRQSQQSEEDYRRAQIRALQEKDQAPQAVNLGGGGFGTWAPRAGLQILREPTAAAAPSSENERLIERWKALPDGDPEKSLIERTLRGYQYTPPVMDAQHQARMGEIGARVDGQIAAKTAPTYTNTHPKPSAPHYEYRMGPDGKLQRRQVN